MTVFLYFTGSPNFHVILTLLQPQLSPEDDIYIVDTTPHRVGVKLAKLYGTTRSYIFVEVGKYNYDTAQRYAYQNMIENKQDGLLSISENAVISQTLISNMKRKNSYGIITPVVIQTPYSQMPSDFKWYNDQEIVEAQFFSDACNFVKKNGGDKIGLLTNETVCILPTQ